MHSTSEVLRPYTYQTPLNAIALASNKSAIRVLTPTLIRVRVLNTPRSLAFTLALTSPEESPVVLVLRQLASSRSLASVGLASSVGAAFVGVVLMVDFEDGEGLGLVRAGVVAALGGLDGVAYFGGAAGGRGWVGALCVGGGGVEGCGCEAEG